MEQRKRGKQGLVVPVEGLPCMGVSEAIGSVAYNHRVAICDTEMAGALPRGVAAGGHYPEAMMEFISR